MKPTITQEPESLSALLAALDEDDRTAATARFRALLTERRLDPDLLRWIQTGWTAFEPTGARDLMDRQLAAARGDEKAATLLLARVSFGAGYTEAGVAIARDCAQRHAAWAAPWFLLCMLLLKTGDAKAHGALHHCLEAFPQPSPGWTSLGQTLLGLGKKEAALVCLARGAPGFALSMQQGLVARDLGRPAQARQFFAEAVRLDRSSPRAWFLLGASAQDAGDRAAAEMAYRTVLALDPDRAEAAVNLGTVLQEAGDLDGARVAYGRAVAGRPDTFGRVAQALTTSPKGELWLDLAALRRSLLG